MPQLTKITLGFDDNTQQEISVGPQATTVETPFGVVSLSGGQPEPPKPAEIAANPGRFDGTLYDPTIGTNPPAFYCGIHIPPTWRECYEAPPTEDFVGKYPNLLVQYFSENMRCLFRIEKLTDRQKQRWGIPLNP